MEKLFLFVLVNFIKSQKDYWYLCDDMSISVGDYVSVYVNDSLEICVVKDKIVATKENAPYYFDKIKKIISKVDKNTAAEEIVFGQTTAANNSNQVYFYQSKQFRANDLPIPIFDKYFKYDENGISEFNIDEELDYYPIPKTVLLKDGPTDASLFSVYSVKDKNDSRFDFYAEIGMNTQKIFIPNSFKSVDFSGCNIQQIILSEGTENIAGNGAIRCRIINIPKSLKIVNSILRIKEHDVKHASFDPVRWERIILDPNNEYFKFIDGILYFVFENKRYILWVDNSVENIIIDEKIFGILPLAKDVDLTIKDEGFYKKQKLFSCGENIAQLLNKFRSVTVERYNSEYNVIPSSIKRLILSDSSANNNKPNRS